MRQYETSHLIKSEDLNHHGTLFAARAAAWFVEAAFVAAGCACNTSAGIVCRNLHNLSFQKPVQKGAILRLQARVAAVGQSSFMVVVRGTDALTEELYVEGAVTFVTIYSETGSRRPHQIVLDEAEDEQETEQRMRANQLKEQAMGKPMHMKK